MREGSKEASGRGNKGEARFCKQGENQVINNRHVMSGGLVLEAGLVFVQGYIAGINASCSRCASRSAASPEAGQVTLVPQISS